MWQYDKKLQYPVKIATPNPALAKLVITQLGGPDGELGAATRYLSQRYGAPTPEVKGLLTDIGTEELGHFEMISAIVYQLTRNLSVEDLKKGGFDAYYVDHTTGIYPMSASGVPFSADILQSTGDVIADLNEDLAAEQKARITYDNLLRLIDDPDVRDPIKFLRAREIVHYQRFGEGLRLEQEKLDSRNFYAYNPEFDKKVAIPTLPTNPTPGVNGNGNTNGGTNGNTNNRPWWRPRTETTETTETTITESDTTITESDTSDTVEMCDDCMDLTNNILKQY